ncbi:hypothetical protein Droror1_Dr00021761 [Drosera rotundifolia]
MTSTKNEGTEETKRDGRGSRGVGDRDEERVKVSEDDSVKGDTAGVVAGEEGRSNDDCGRVQGGSEIHGRSYGRSGVRRLEEKESVGLVNVDSVNAGV